MKFTKILILLLFFPCLYSIAQQNLTMHFMEELHQSNRTNPALFNGSGIINLQKRKK